MPVGPGKYDAVATAVREETQAACVVVAILGGNKGDGFSVQSHARQLAPSTLVALLRSIADDIEEATVDAAPAPEKPICPACKVVETAPTVLQAFYFGFGAACTREFGTPGRVVRKFFCPKHKEEMLPVLERNGLA